jgi:hypothetical protein
VRAIGSDLRSKRFLGQWAKETFAAIGFLAVFAGLIDVFFTEAFQDRGAEVAIIGGTVAVMYGAIRAWPRPIEHRYSAPNTTIRIVKGDIFEEPGHIVIGACDTFDTSIPNIISRQSLQGQALERLYGGDVQLLDRELEAALRGETPTGYVDKEGKTDRFPIGTVAAVPQGGRQVLFAAYTEMSPDNQARSSTDRVWKGLLSMWDACSRYCNGQPIAVPVIGGGQARIAQILPAQDAIRFIAFSFMLASRHEKVSDELRIVVRADDYNRLDRLELQAFLDSLEPS